MVGVRMFTVREHFDETPSIKTMLFDQTMNADPGQFVMVWVPGVDEFPMSVSHLDGTCGITYQKIGDGTKALAEKKIGDKVGIRGPYGTGYTVTGSRILVVAGGAGMAPAAPLIERACRKGLTVDVVIGARTAKEVLSERRALEAGAKVHVSTDDGSRGFKGFATELASDVLAKDRFDQIYACGPERMIVTLMTMAERHSIPMQASLERLMKCGIGICDSCALDGVHVCRDGPVFELKMLKSFGELGKTKLDHCGRKTPI
ncbi:MAG TPA: dihydroorotate dehydrogenase electron transfer subunit [Candidatus Paceibacterota bacterium]|nr:dihydroorotate dehydrogenase electron transfer subunit [Candidatus Paceibacterota bacterium]